MRELRIARGAGRLKPLVRSGKTSWEQLAKKLLDFKVTGETYAEYMAMSAEEQANIKDVGYLVGGPFSGKTRRKSELLHRSVVTLDVDHVDHGLDLVEAYEGFECVIHSTHKHSEASPRLRIVFPLSRDVTPDEYEAVARNLAAWSDMDWFDDTTFEVSRIMYWPSRSSDGELVAIHNEGAWVDPDDWEPDQDWMDWPRSSRVTKATPPTAEAADPLTKAGWIGAFCRTYDIHAAINNFIPDVFETTDWENRYRPIGATGPAGAIVYDDVFLYSHHENPEAISQKNLNAFDLVRLLRYGEEDDDPDLNMTQRESYKAMSDLCAQDPAVVSELEELADELDDDLPEEQESKRRHIDDVIEEIHALNDNQRSKDLEPWLFQLAPYSKHEYEQALKVLKLKYRDPPTLEGLKDRIKDIRKTTAGIDSDANMADVERELVDEILAEHFAGGEEIRRIGQRWWRYRNSVWVPYGNEAMRGKVQKSLIRLREELPEDVAQLTAAIADSKTSSLVPALSNAVAARLAEQTEDIEDPMCLLRRFPTPIVNTINKTIEFDYDGEMRVRDPDPDDFFTLRVNTEYDPDAQCPEWDRFCDLIFSDCIDPEEMVRHLEELGGYIISMAKWLKCWVLFHGPTDTGKSTLLTVFKELLGEACLAMEMSRFGETGSGFANYSLLGKLLLADDDFDKSAHLPDGFIKKISEEKRITTDVKFGDPLTFESRALPLVCSNHWPVTRDVSDAFRNRALVFDFTHQIRGEEQSDERRDKMLTELPGILNRFVGGLARLRQRGQWDVPMDASAAHGLWESQSNQAIRYMREQLVVSPGAFVRASHVWADYRNWAPGRGAPLGQHELYQRLEQLIGLRVKRDGYEGWPGYELAALDAELGVSGDEMFGD